MQATGRVAGYAEGQGRLGSSSSPDGPAGHKSLGRGPEEAGAMAGGTPQVAQAFHAPILGSSALPRPVDMLDWTCICSLGLQPEGQDANCSSITLFEEWLHGQEDGHRGGNRTGK